MGTRADFYAGPAADDWIGSVGWDGDEWMKDCPLRQANTPEKFREAVRQIAQQRNDFTDPCQGWPWPWSSSENTDIAYRLEDGKVEVYRWGSREGSENPEWPDMSDRQSVTLGRRSGLTILTNRQAAGMPEGTTETPSDS